MDIRTGAESQPKGVKCPHCQRYPRYRGYWPADEAGFGSTSDGSVSLDSMVRTMRRWKKQDLLKAIQNAKIGDTWVGHKDNKMFVLFQFGLPFHEIGLVKEQNGCWEGYVSEQKIIGCNDPDTAKHYVQNHLVEELGYIFPLS